MLHALLGPCHSKLHHHSYLLRCFINRPYVVTDSLLLRKGGNLYLYTRACFSLSILNTPMALLAIIFSLFAPSKIRLYHGSKARLRPIWLGWVVSSIMACVRLICEFYICWLANRLSWIEDSSFEVNRIAMRQLQDCANIDLFGWWMMEKIVMLERKRWRRSKPTKMKNYVWRVQTLYIFIPTFASS